MLLASNVSISEPCSEDKEALVGLVGLPDEDSSWEVLEDFQISR